MQPPPSDLGRPRVVTIDEIIPPEPLAGPPRTFDRLAAVTIQGGGLFGLSLLGQLNALLKQGFRPIALAGTSAGAIVATLHWAGLTPTQIAEEVATLAEHPSRLGRFGTGLTDLMGHFEPRHRPFNFRSYRNMESWLKQVVCSPIQKHLRTPGDRRQLSTWETVLGLLAKVDRFFHQLPRWVGRMLIAPPMFSQLRMHLFNRGLF